MSLTRYIDHLTELGTQLGNHLPLILGCALTANLLVGIGYLIYKFIQVNYVLFQIQEDMDNYPF